MKNTQKKPGQRKPLGTGSRVLVTGGAGFVGSHLVERLVDLAASVTVVDDLSTGRIENVNSVLSGIEMINEGVVGFAQSGLVETGDYDVIFHLAANSYIPPSVHDPQFDFDVNLRGTFVLLECLRRMDFPPVFVNVSTAGVYGNPVKLPITEEDPTVPISPYGVSKLAAERYVSVFSKLYGMPATSLRLFSVYGPRQRKQVLYDLLEKIRINPRCIEILGDGSQTRDLVFVTDVVEAMILVADTAPLQGEAFNVASGTSHSIRELAEALCRTLDSFPELTFTGQVRLGDAQKWEVDIGKVKQLGFVPRVLLDEGLKRVVEWYATEPASSLEA